MSNRSQYSFEIAQMGKVWVASISLLGISVIGATQTAAMQALFEAANTHSLAGGTGGYPGDPCEACS